MVDDCTGVGGGLGIGGAGEREELERGEIWGWTVVFFFFVHLLCESQGRVPARDSHEEMIISWQFSPGLLRRRQKTELAEKQKADLDVHWQKVLTHATVDCDWLLATSSDMSLGFHSNSGLNLETSFAFFFPLETVSSRGLWIFHRNIQRKSD